MADKERKKAPLRPLSKAGILLMALMLLQMFLVFILSFSGGNNSDPVLIVAGYESNFPTASMRNSLHAAGFELVVSDNISSASKNRLAVVLLAGEDQLAKVAEYKDDENIMGFVLVLPDMKENISLDGLDSKSPHKDIAIFAGKDNSSSVADMSTAKIIYERLSGDDTVYGVPARTGGPMGSTIYFNNDQNRYLSISSKKADDPAELLFSPVFQNELAGYLNSTYRDSLSRDMSSGRVISWYIFALISVFLWITGLFIYLIPLRTIPDKQQKVKINTMIPLTLLAVFFSLAVAIGSVFPVLRHYTEAAVFFLPVLFAVAGMIVRLVKLSKVSPEFRLFGTGNTSPVRPLLMSLSAVLFIFLTALLFGDMRFVVMRSVPWAVFALAFIVDMFCSSINFATDGKVGNGGKVLTIFMGIPCLMMTLCGFFFRDHVMVFTGLGSFMASVIPYAMVRPLRNHTNIPVITGILHASVYIILVLFTG